MTIMNQAQYSVERRRWDAVLKRFGSRQWFGGMGTFAYVVLGVVLQEGLLTTAGLSVLMWLQVLRGRGDQSRQLEVLSRQTSALSVLPKRSEAAGVGQGDTAMMRSLLSQMQALTRQVAGLKLASRSGDEAVLHSLGQQVAALQAALPQSGDEALLRSLLEQVQGLRSAVDAEPNEAMMRSLLSQMQALTRQVAGLKLASRSGDEAVLRSLGQQVAALQAALPQSGDEALLRSLLEQVQGLRSAVDAEPNEALLRSLLEQVEGVRRQSDQVQALLAQSEPQAVLRTEPLVGRGRVCILVDEANISFPLLQQGRRLNFRTLLTHLKGDATLDQAIIFLGRTPGAERQQGFHHFLKTLGYQLNTKETIRRNDGSSKANFDVEMTLEMIQRLPHYDTLVLVSGDGDFAAALRQLKSFGRRVEVVSWVRQTSHCLRDVADQFTALEDWEAHITRS